MSPTTHLGTTTATGTTRRLTQALLHSRVGGRAARATAAVRITAGVIFVLFGAVKFLLPDMELAEFVRFGFPPSGVIVFLVGLLEAGAGLALVLGAATRLAAAALAVNMAGAVLTAGIQVGGPIHLGLAPALLVAMLYLLWSGAGAAALDRRLTAVIAPTST